MSAAPAAAVRMARLADASLLHVTHEHGPARYMMLAIVRARLRRRAAPRRRRGRASAYRARPLDPRPGTGRGRRRPAGEPLHRLLAYRADLLAAVLGTLDAGEVELAGAITAALGWCTHSVLDGELLKLARDVARDPRLPATPVAALAGASGALHAAQLGDLDEAHRLGARALAIASTPEEQCMALQALGVACVYRGEHAESMRHWRRLLENPGVPAPLRLDAHATFALLACFQSDQSAARQHAARAVAAARDAGPIGAFATYTMGEVRLLEDPAAAVEILELAVSQAEVGRTAQIAEVARIALVSALVRLGRHDEALRVFPDLLHQLRRRGGWP